MKVAFMVNTFPTLSETFILSQITGLINNNIEVEIIAKRRNSGITHKEIDAYNLPERCYYLEEACHKPAKKLKRLYEAVKLLVISNNNRVMLIKSLNVFKYGIDALSLSLLYKVYSLLLKRNCTYDIILCHFGVNGDLAVKLRDIGVLKGKIITVFHGYDITSYLKNRGENIYNNLFKKGDLFLPISNNWANKLIQLGCPSDRIIVHRMGVDVQKFSFSAPTFVKGNKLRIVSVARLVEKKGIEYGIIAVIKALEINPDIEYRIIGDGPLKEQISDLINQSGLSNKIILEGQKNQDDVIKTLKHHADLFIMPSITAKDGDQEGIPVVLMEALAMGLPVIATKHSGIPELVKDKVTGYLVPERDSDALSKSLIDFMNNMGLNKRMSVEGRKLIEIEYNNEKQNCKLINIFIQLTGSSETLK